MNTSGSPGTALDDAQLLRRIARRDRAAFSQLYDRYAGVLYSTVVRILNNQEEAADVLQEVFVQIWDKAPAYDPTLGKPFNWAMTMTRHKAIDRLRALRRRYTFIGEITVEAEEEARDFQTGPDEVFTKDQAALVRSALAALPLEQRQAIELAFLGGMTQNEIADSLRQPLGTVKARIRRGMLKLRDSLPPPVMIDERTETQASLYALGALPDDEARLFEVALRAQPQLRVLVQEFRAAAVALAAGFPRTDPPAGLKAKITAAIDTRKVVPATVVPLDSAPGPGWLDWMPWALAACFAVLCVVLISIGKNLHQQALSLSERLEERAVETDDLRGRLEQLQMQAGKNTTNYEQRIVNIEKQAVARIDELNRKSAALTNQLFGERADLQRRLGISEAGAAQLARDKKTLEAAIQVLQISGGDRFSNAKIAIMLPTPDGPPGAIGASVWIAQDQRGVIALEKLPTVLNPAAQDYQLWLIDPNSPVPISAGVFLPDASGSVRLPFGAASAKTVDRFAVSIEPKGGAPRPTGKIILTGG